jgi:hypothetical protein
MAASSQRHEDMPYCVLKSQTLPQMEKDAQGIKDSAGLALAPSSEIAVRANHANCVETQRERLRARRLSWLICTIFAFPLYVRFCSEPSGGYPESA